MAANALLNTQPGLGVKLLPRGNRPAGKEEHPHWQGPVGLHLGLLSGTVGIPILQAGTRPSFKHRLKAGNFTACQGDFLV